VPRTETKTGMTPGSHGVWDAPTARLLRLLSLLQTRRDWPGAVLAERLDVTPRTVRRDVEHLRELGYGITSARGRDGGYRLDAGTHLPPMLFDDERAVALAVALQSAAVSGVAISEAAARALLTVRQVLPARLRHRMVALDATTLPGADNHDVEPEVLLAVSRAARDREVLRFDYASRGDEPGGAPRRTEPHHVVVAWGRWYLVAWDLDADGWRIFRLDRLTPRVPPGPRFVPREVPSGVVAAYVAARFKGSTDDVWPCRGRAVIALPSRDVLPFAGDGVVEEIDARHCRLTAGSWSWAALAASFGRFDAGLSEVGPRELREAFAALAARFGDAGQPSGRLR